MQTDLISLVIKFDSSAGVTCVSVLDMGLTVLGKSSKSVAKAIQRQVRK